MNLEYMRFVYLRGGFFEGGCLTVTKFLIWSYPCLFWKEDTPGKSSINRGEFFIFSQMHYLARAARFGIPSHIEC